MPAAWARSIAPAIRASAATSPSRCCRRRFAADPDRLHRFEQEARATAALNDPNIVAIYDVGTADGQPYVVTELLDGETLRGALACGPLPLRKALAYAQQIARGIAAAHRRGIVHRDLKPENVFVTADGLVKILDFGLAKLTEAGGRRCAALCRRPRRAWCSAPSATCRPSRRKGELADHRSDIFSFGAVLYEMLSGQRAFQGDSPVETLSAILKEQPPDLTLVVPGLSPALARIVDRCLEKNRDERFQTAADLRFRARGDLRRVDAGRGRCRAPRRVPMATGRPRRLARGDRCCRRLRRSARAGPSDGSRGSTSSRSGAAPCRARGSPPTGRPSSTARPGKARPTELFSTRPEAPEARPLQMTGTGIFAMSSKGEMAVVLEPRGFGRVEGTLARAPLAGGLPRQLAEGVLAADWGPTGRSWRSSRSASGRTCSSIPIGRTLYNPSPGHITHIRVSPSGDAVAVLVASRVWRHRRLGRAGRPGRAVHGRSRRGGTACSAWPGRRAARRSGSPAPAPARRRRFTR